MKVSSAFAQEEVFADNQGKKDTLFVEKKQDSISLDSIPKNKPLLLDLINYSAEDSVKIDQKTNKIRF